MKPETRSFRNADKDMFWVIWDVVKLVYHMRFKKSCAWNSLTLKSDLVSSKIQF